MYIKSPKTCSMVKGVNPGTTQLDFPPLPNLFPMSRFHPFQIFQVGVTPLCIAISHDSHHLVTPLLQHRADAQHLGSKVPPGRGYAPVNGIRPFESMYLLLKIGGFQIAMSVYQRVICSQEGICLNQFDLLWGFLSHELLHSKRFDKDVVPDHDFFQMYCVIRIYYFGIEVMTFITRFGL